MMKNTALVLEGGGFRGIFTAGILEVFLQNKFFFESVIGVSAGSSYGASYISQQAGRNIAVNEFIGDKRYMSFRNLLRTGSLFSWEFIYKEIPQTIIPFDYQAVAESTSKFIAVTSNCESGEPEYYQINKMSRKDFNTVLIASGSLPLVAPMVSFDGKLLLDGGLTDSIPFEYALNNGHKKAVVVLTQAKGYIKDPLKYRLLFKWVYRKYPKVYEMMLSRADNYNASIRRLEQLEKEGVLFVIRPEEKLRVSRLENKPHKTAKVYASAMELAKRKLSELQNWLGQ